MKRGCLVVHGLLGNPNIVSNIREKLLENNYQVISPLLAGHGSSAKELSNVKWQDWYKSVRDAYVQLRQDCDKVYYVGLSLGALLGLKLAIDEGWGISALALIGTPLCLTRDSEVLAFLTKYTPLKFILRSVPRSIKRAVKNNEGQKFYEQNSINKIPANSVFELQKLINEIKMESKKIANPILVVHGQYDKIAPVSNVEILKKSISSGIIEEYIAPNSGHIVNLDNDQNEVVNKIINHFNNI